MKTIWIWRCQNKQEICSLQEPETRISISVFPVVLLVFLVISCEITSGIIVAPPAPGSLPFACTVLQFMYQPPNSLQDIATQHAHGHQIQSFCKNEYFIKEILPRLGNVFFALSFSWISLSSWRTRFHQIFRISKISYFIFWICKSSGTGCSLHVHCTLYSSYLTAVLNLNLKWKKLSAVMARS